MTEIAILCSINSNPMQRQPIFRDIFTKPVNLQVKIPYGPALAYNKKILIKILYYILLSEKITS